MKITPCLMIIFAVAALLVFHGQAELLDGANGEVLNATYTIEKREISLIDGRAEIQAAPGSAGKIITSVFGKPVLILVLLG